MVWEMFYHQHVTKSNRRRIKRTERKKHRKENKKHNERQHADLAQRCNKTTARTEQSTTAKKHQIEINSTGTDKKRRKKINIADPKPPQWLTHTLDR